MDGKPVYLDYNASTPVDPRIVEAMGPAFTEAFANPSSSHAAGREASRLVDEARGLVAALVGMSEADVVFVSGATEANNLALRGSFGRDGGNRIIVAATEHKSVLDAAAEEEGAGRADLRTVPVDGDGVLDLAALEESIEGHGGNALVSVSAANSETGVIGPVGEAARIAHRHGALLHCDATQAVGRIPFDAPGLGADMVSVSSHKMYGPKGIGALVANREARRALRPLQHGGGQEDGLRSGTLNVPGIVGFGQACTIAAGEASGAGRQRELRDRLERSVEARVPGVTVNGGGARRLPNTSNMRFAGVDADAMMTNMPLLAVSSGSACSSATMEPSHVLVAMGLGEGANESVRFSLGRGTTEEEVDRAADMAEAAAGRIRMIEGAPHAA